MPTMASPKNGDANGMKIDEDGAARKGFSPENSAIVLNQMTGRDGTVNNIMCKPLQNGLSFPV